MIVSFSISNFRSFSEEQTISFVASKRLAGHHEDHAVPIPGSDERVLRAAVIYGANGAGKSNLFKALAFAERVARQPRPRESGTGREIFRFGGGQEKPTSADLQFIVQDKLYRYGFKVDDVRVTEEWLLQVNGGRERTIYERATDEQGRVSIDAPGLKTGGKLAALAKVGGPQNQSFLATARATVDWCELDEEVRGILGWLEEGLVFIVPDGEPHSLDHRFEDDEALRSFASGFLGSSITGFEGACRGVPAAADHSAGNGASIALTLDEESHGTRRLLRLIPALYDLQSRDTTCLVDEIDRSMHPILVRNLLDRFLDSPADGRRQLIVTTHESNLLDLDLLRRDEIWFAEKDQAGATHLYSLADFHVRTDLDIRKHYLQGRFGAIPFLGDANRLKETEPQSK